mmetsp:Transcript_58604/g.141494  ORF Transcript_58604/g.141494 Transcript_58604/m.141494 type:complete len:230 (+) Transcript_58604:578-1267(+)
MSTDSVDRPTSSEPKTRAVVPLPVSARGRFSERAAGPCDSPCDSAASPCDSAAKSLRASCGRVRVACRKFAPARPEKATALSDALSASARSPKSRAPCSTSVPSAVASRSQPFQADRSSAHSLASEPALRPSWAAFAAERPARSSAALSLAAWTTARRVMPKLAQARATMPTFRASRGSTSTTQQRLATKSPPGSGPGVPQPGEPSATSAGAAAATPAADSSDIFGSVA